MSNTLFIFLVLYWANLVLDFPFQNAFMAEYKSKNGYILFVHSCIWGIGLSIVLSAFNHVTIFMVLFLVAIHYFVDAWKCRGYYKIWGIKDIHALYIDQAIHVLQILVVIFFPV